MKSKTCIKENKTGKCSIIHNEQKNEIIHRTIVIDICYNDNCNNVTMLIMMF